MPGFLIGSGIFLVTWRASIILDLKASQLKSLIVYKVDAAEIDFESSAQLLGCGGKVQLEDLTSIFSSC